MKDFYSSYFPHKQASYLPDADFAAFLPISLSFPPCLFFSALFSFPSVLRSSSATLLGPARCVPESCSSARAGDEINPCKTPQGPNRASFLASATFEGGGGIFRVGDPLASRPDPPPEACTETSGLGGRGFCQNNPPEIRPPKPRAAQITFCRQLS